MGGWGDGGRGGGRGGRGQTLSSEVPSHFIVLVHIQLLSLKVRERVLCTCTHTKIKRDTEKNTFAAAKK